MSVMSNFGKIVSYAFNSLDMSSAANDVIVVRHQDGTLHSSPFNVRFGKVKVINPGDKVVMIDVNGKVTSAVMKMGADGVAYWLRPTMHAPERPESPLESPNTVRPTAPSNAPCDSPPALMLDGSHHSLARSPSMGSPRSPNLSAAAAVHSDPAAPSLPPLAPVTVETVEFEQMTGKEKAKFEELYQSFAQSEAASASFGQHAAAGSATALPAATAAAVSAGGDGALSVEEVCGSCGSITLSKFASYDDLTVGASASLRHSTEGGMHSVAVPSADAADDDDDEGTDEDDDDDPLGEDEDGGFDDVDALSDGGSSNDGNASGAFPAGRRIFFKPTLTPLHVDLLKLGLKDGLNVVRYSTPTTLRGRVVVEARIFLYASHDKIVISDIDGTVTKSDVWGHLLPLIGRDWTHSGICSLYSKIAQNGYRIIYLTARSVSQSEQTRQFLWGIEQGGVKLPQGPVFTTPDRIFAALTKEVSKKSHEFKIACLQSIIQAFPQHSRPFYAGFGNRIGDVISYTASGIPKHKIFIIDTNSVLHVCHVKQSYKDLAHLVDHTFPPLAVRAPRATLLEPLVPGADGDAGGVKTQFQRSLCNDGLGRPSGGGVGASSALNTSNGGLREGESVDLDYNNFNYWRIPPEQLIAQRKASPPPSPVPPHPPAVGADGAALATAAASDQHPAPGGARGGSSEGDAAGDDARKKKKGGIWSKLWTSSEKESR